MSGGGWAEANQRWLSAALGEVRHALERHLGAGSAEEPAAAESPMPQWPQHMAPPALERLVSRLGLTAFERSLLLLAAGVELEAACGELLAAAHGDAASRHATFALALACLPEAHWSALSPERPLRAWRLLELGEGATLATSPLRIDERVLHHLCGVDFLDQRLAGLVLPEPEGAELVPSQLALVERLARAWAESSPADRLPIFQLLGRDGPGKRAVAAAACDLLGLRLYRMSRHVLPSAPAELDALARLWNREAQLDGVALLLDCEDLAAGDAGALHAASRVVEALDGPLFVTTRDRQSIGEASALYVEVPGPQAREQAEVWTRALRAALPELDRPLAAQVAALVSQFDLRPTTIRAASTEALATAASGAEGVGGGGSATPERLEEALWDAARSQARPRLGELAQRLRPQAGWQDLVLPPSETATLRDIAAQVRHRLTVYESWGFAAKSARGLGISALFTGASGTGKTMAAEVLANELRLDLYRIDLSQVVSKYIGETEKNLRRVFDEAEEGGAILLFDEADALFGKRSEVKDSHDRYANIEIGYLLQRMEAYRGLAILTTNMKDSLDAAFLRRLRFIVQFPFPGAAEREEIWRRTFPAETPTEDLDFTRLAQLNMAGGNIRNIALHGAFLAARAGGPVTMSHLLDAARTESAKLQRPLSQAEVRGWR